MSNASGVFSLSGRYMQLLITTCKTEMNPSQWVGVVFVCVLSRFQNPHANLVMCMPLNEPKINTFVKSTPQVAESVFLCLSPETC